MSARTAPEVDPSASLGASDSVEGQFGDYPSIATEFFVNGQALGEVDLASLSGSEVEKLLIRIQSRGGKELRAIAQQHHGILKGAVVSDEEYALAKEFGSDRFFARIPGPDADAGLVEVTAFVPEEVLEMRALSIDLFRQEAFNELLESRIDRIRSRSDKLISSPPVREAFGSKIVQYDDYGDEVGMVMTTMFGFP